MAKGKEPEAFKKHEFKKGAKHDGGMHPHHKHVEQTAGKLHGGDPYKAAHDGKE